MKKLILILFAFILCIHAKGNEEIIEKYIDKIKVNDPLEYKNLKIFPLISTKILSSQTYITLDQASDKAWLKIREIGSGQVNSVEIKNIGDQPVFAMTGEMITGAKQDRMINQDILLPAKSDWIRVPVYCVEHGRWVSVSSEFKSGELLVPNAVRSKAKIHESQSEVWDEIASSQEKLGIASGTDAVRANYEDEETQEKINEYTKKFEKIPDLSNGTIGVVVTSGNRIICLDLFANNLLLKKLWKKLIKSYTMDALSGTKAEISKARIEDFLEAFDQANYVSTGTAGLGTLLKVESDFGKGSVLLYKSAVVHMDFFPSDGIIEENDLRLDIRRDQRFED
jgi:hypothetical protein